MHTTNLMVWVDRLRTPGLAQVTGHLAEVFQPEIGGDEVVGFCCLGVGCDLAGVNRYRSDGDRLYYFGPNGDSGLPPVQFHRWLGIAEDVHDLDGDESFNVWLDTPEDLDTLDGETFPDGIPASALNDDWHLSFQQIGDMLAYFGVRPLSTNL